MKVYRSAKVLVLRPEIFSVTLGFFWAVLVLIITIIAIASRQSSIYLIDFLKAIYPFYRPNLLGLILGPVYGFISGFLLGFIIGYIYSFLIRRKLIKNAESLFNLDPAKDKNVIQEGKAEDGAKPYTIAFVANPVIYLPAYMVTDTTISNLLKLEGDDKIPQSIIEQLSTMKDREIRGRGEFIKRLSDTIGETEIHQYSYRIMKESRFTEKSDLFEPDPIMEDNDIFFKVVIRCLKSFANNELLSLPEIFPRLRLISIFKNQAHELVDKNALCAEFDPSLDVIQPRSDMKIPTDYLAGFNEHYDVIFLISASERLIRSSAYFTKDGEEGKPFKLTFNGKLGKNEPTKIHAFYPLEPGVVALSAWDDRLKTPVHEFAHAMSSIENGAIGDEYIDDKSDTKLKEIMINKRYRENKNDPIPDLFAKYQLVKDDSKKDDSDEDATKYFSDRDRRDKKSDWISYVPEKRKPYVSCIMDIAYFGFRFDKLIFDFMYDRILTKLNRK